MSLYHTIHLQGVCWFWRVREERVVFFAVGKSRKGFSIRFDSYCNLLLWLCGMCPKEMFHKKEKKKKISPSCLCLNSVLQCFVLRLWRGLRCTGISRSGDHVLGMTLCVLTFLIPFLTSQFWHVLDYDSQMGCGGVDTNDCVLGREKNQEAREPAVFRDWESGEQTEMWTREEEEERWFTCSAGGLSVSKPAPSMKSQEGTGELMKWAGRPN